MAAAARPVRLLLREDGAEKLRVGLCAHDLVVLVDVALRRGKVFEREHHLCTHGCRLRYMRLQAPLRAVVDATRMRWQGPEPLSLCLWVVGPGGTAELCRL